MTPCLAPALGSKFGLGYTDGTQGVESALCPEAGESVRHSISVACIGGAGTFSPNPIGLPRPRVVPPSCPAS